MGLVDFACRAARLFLFLFDRTPVLSCRPFSTIAATSETTRCRRAGLQVLKATLSFAEIAPCLTGTIPRVTVPVST